MSDTKFTEGPWLIGFDDGSGITKGRTHTTFITTNLHQEGVQQVVCECRSSFAFEAMPVDANAHLIAAAPDMYEVLDAVKDLLNGYGQIGEEEMEQIVSDVLAKARGES